MKKFLALALTLTLTLPLLFSCGDKGTTADTVGGKPKDFSYYYNTSLSASLGDGYTKAEKLSLPQNAAGFYANGAFYYYRDPSLGKYLVYSVTTGDQVLALPATTSAPTFTLYDNYFTVKAPGDDGTKVLSVYSENGTLLATAGADDTLNQSSDGFILDGKYYRLKDGALEKVYTFPPFLSPSSVSLVNNYAIHRSGHTITYYNDKFEAVASYDIPGEAFDSSYRCLKDGKMLVQYFVYCDPADSKYDMLVPDSDGTAKCNIYTVLYDPVKDKAEELDLDVIINGVYYNSPFNGSSFNGSSFNGFSFREIFTDKVENILAYRAIKNGQLDQSQTYYSTLGNDGKIGDRLDNLIEGQNGLITPAANGTYVAPTKSGYAILDANGKVKTNLVALGTATGYGYRYQNSVYDGEMKLAVDLSTTNSIYWSENDNAILYEKEEGPKTHYYIYTRYGERELLPPEGAYSSLTVRLYDNYYTVAHTVPHPTVSYDNYSYMTFYAFDGTVLFTATTTDADGDSLPYPSVVCETDSAAIVQHYDATTYALTYTRLSK